MKIQFSDEGSFKCIQVRIEPSAFFLNISNPLFFSLKEREKKGLLEQGLNYTHLIQKGAFN